MGHPMGWTATGTTYGQEISNELQNRVTFILPEPVYAPAVMTRHAKRVKIIRTGQDALKKAREAKRSKLEAEVNAGTNPDAEIDLAILNNEIAQGDFEMSEDIPSRDDSSGDESLPERVEVIQGEPTTTLQA